MALKVVVTRNIGKEALGILAEYKSEGIDVVLWPEDRTAPREWALENVKGAVGLLVTLSDKIDAEIVEAAGQSLRVVSTMSVGYEHIDLQALRRTGVRLGFTPDILTDAVADIAVMLALMASRNVPEALQVVNNDKWPTVGWAPFGFCGPQIGGHDSYTVGFLGFGRIAQATLHRLIPFGIRRCLYATSSRTPPLRSAEEDAHLQAKYNLEELKRVSTEEVAEKSDLVFVMTPGGEATYHLVNEDFLRKMKKTSILVNPARGPIVDSDALVKALKEGWIWGAGVDVVEGEPNVRNDHPLVKEPRAVVLPHIGSATHETRNAMATLAVRNLVSGVLGEPIPVEFAL